VKLVDGVAAGAGVLLGSESGVPSDCVTRAAFRLPLEVVDACAPRALRDGEEDAFLRLVISVADLWPIVLVHPRYRPSVHVLEFALGKVDAVPLRNTGVIRRNIRGD